MYDSKVESQSTKLQPCHNIDNNLQNSDINQIFNINENYQPNPKTPGRNTAITSLTLGIISILIAFIAVPILYVMYVGVYLEEVNTNTAILGLVLSSAVSVLGIIFGIISKKKKYSSKTPVIGLVLSIVSLLSIVIIPIVLVIHSINLDSI